MNVERLLLVFLLFGISVEGTLIPIPFVFLLSIVLFLYDASARNLILIFLAGLFLDGLRGSSFGFTSLFTLASIGFFTILKRSFEEKGYHFQIFLSFLFAFFYAWILSYDMLYLILSSTLVLAGCLLYKLYRRGVEA